MKFAAPLKSMVGMFLVQAGLGHLSERMLEGDLKEEPIAALGGVTPRRLMETLGTDWGRKLIDPEVWAKVTEARLRALLEQGTSVVVDDLEALAHFEMAVDRRARRMVQENSLGLFAPWMSHPVAQVMLQFRTFVIGAHSKQLLHNIHMWDRESVSVFLATTFAGAMGHVAQTMANAPGLTEKQLEERLSVKGIAMGGLQRTGMSALLPLVADSILTIAGRGGVFNSRSTGQTSDLWFGNPTTGLIDDVPGAINALVEPLMEGRRRSKAEVRAMVRPLIWQNILPVTTLLGAMSRDLPDYAPKSHNR